jgi:hypothetical protein
VAHGVEDRDVRERAVHRVVEGVAADLVGGGEQAADHEPGVPKVSGGSRLHCISAARFIGRRRRVHS